MEHDKWMGKALKEAEKALDAGEVPIGAVIVKDGTIVGRGYNRTETDKDPTAHAEITAIRRATKKLGGWRLTGCTMYVTTEPCTMCAGALVLSRVDRVVIGTPNIKAGACGSLKNLLQDERLNHTVDITSGVLQNECAEIMKTFFRSLREKRNKMKSESEEKTE